MMILCEESACISSHGNDGGQINEGSRLDSSDDVVAEDSMNMSSMTDRYLVNVNWPTAWSSWLVYPHSLLRQDLMNPTIGTCCCM